ncbi:Bifunctional folate synthesis protein [Porphyromonas levii]|uniref:2-amino-4-hydroxy-6-hydroxymethyldihydropteridine pyrophosphokinase n=1 Tax=Porphyromonas levii TaxID=28114 RepID=A0A4Y8WRI0_9PORP|nr:Bifunctional folate synthesis protein [Porphyromonas levii]MBR8712459.1 Bifunctional folate synthesis protein [Porphyromonas levii]MBR8714369.1 Bifunctional folate synthesis protein [Porphyromonas levii]MBR8726910.1 Bifunctional folate synthesis protein [Porphyromonas levii]MBR8728927.1 Bifunctional folate synthesis protein [Porphyromonas levii]
MRERVYIALGSNIGNRASILAQAVGLLSERVGVVTVESKVVETEPVGFVSEHPFLNQVVAVDTELSPLEVLETTQNIERELGRWRKSVDGVYLDRTCDLDIILYGDRIMEEAFLTIPHKLFRERKFVLEPLAEIAPEVIDPVTGKRINELLWDVL